MKKSKENKKVDITMKKTNQSTLIKKQLAIATKCVYALIQELFDAGFLDVKHITTEYNFNKNERKFLNEIVNELYSE